MNTRKPWSEFAWIINIVVALVFTLLGGLLVYWRMEVVEPVHISNGADWVRLSPEEMHLLRALSPDDGKWNLDDWNEDADYRAQKIVPGTSYVPTDKDYYNTPAMVVDFDGDRFDNGWFDRDAPPPVVTRERVPEGWAAMVCRDDGEDQSRENQCPEEGENKNIYCRTYPGGWKVCWISLDALD